MRFAPFTYQGNTVSEYGRLLYWVTSNSRKDLKHLVDLEGFERWPSCCACESWKYGERPCRHISACLHAIAHWAGVKEEIREEWVDTMRFLMSLGYSFRESLESESMKVLKVHDEPKPTVRKYRMDKR